MESILKFKSQQGYLIIIATVLIVVVGFVSAMLVYMSIGSANSSANTWQSNRALYLATSGLEIAKRDVIDKKLACTNYSRSAFILNGEYAVTGNSISISTKLAANISATATTISLVSATAFSPEGGIVQIDKESILYETINGNNLEGVIRGMYGTIAKKHSRNTSVIQSQCALTSTGAVPSIVAAQGKRTLRQVLLGSQLSLGGYTPAVLAVEEVQLAGNAFVVNSTVSENSTEFSGSTIVTKSVADISGSGGTKVDNGNGQLVQSSGKIPIPGKKADVVENYVGISANELSTDYLFNKIFQHETDSGQALKNYIRSTADKIIPADKSEIINDLNNPANAGKIIWVDGEIQLAGKSTITIGSIDNPVVLIVNGGVKLAGNASFTVNGLLYVIGSFQGQGSSSVIGNGMFVAEGGIALPGNGVVNFEPSIISAVSQHDKTTTSYSPKAAFTKEEFK